MKQTKRRVDVSEDRGATTRDLKQKGAEGVGNFALEGS
jgi:hypothetical protein